MKYAVLIVRILLGLAFVVFGSNIFFHFIPGSDQTPPGEAGVFAGALMRMRIRLRQLGWSPEETAS